jgi:DNA-binding IclR family transcriptional regulator
VIRPVTAGTIGEHTGLTTGAVTGLMDRLEKAGYVRRDRDPRDRRKVLEAGMVFALETYWPSADGWARPGSRRRSS